MVKYRDLVNILKLINLQSYLHIMNIVEGFENNFKSQRMGEFAVRLYLSEISETTLKNFI